jgi:hypothetical protein
LIDSREETSKYVENLIDAFKKDLREIGAIFCVIVVCGDDLKHQNWFETNMATFPCIGKLEQLKHLLLIKESEIHDKLDKSTPR